MASDKTLAFDDSNFESEVLQSDVPVLVDFWAEWCGPCVMLAPVIDELAEDNQGRVKVGKLDIDQAAATAAQYGVQSIPTVILFHNGQPVEKIVGQRQKRDYQQVIDNVASNA